MLQKRGGVGGRGSHMGAAAVFGFNLPVNLQTASWRSGGVLVTDKEAGLSSHSLTSTHSALVSGRHLESRKQLKARREGPPRCRAGGCVHLDVQCLHQSWFFFFFLFHKARSSSPLSRPSLTPSLNPHPPIPPPHTHTHTRY